jgi:hypothetical protein
MMFINLQMGLLYAPGFEGEMRELQGTFEPEDYRC